MKETTGILQESKYEVEDQGSVNAQLSGIQMEFETMIALEKTTTRDRTDQFIFRAPTMDDVEATFELVDICSNHMIGSRRHPFLGCEANGPCPASIWINQHGLC